MKANIEYKNRQLIPRLTTSYISHYFIYNAFDTPYSINSGDPIFFDKVKYRWLRSKNTVTAKELIASSLLFNKGNISEVKNAIKYLQKNDSLPNKIIYTIIKLLKDETICDDSFIQSTEQLKTEIFKLIRELKYNIWEYPRNALAWIDLAYYYTILGQNNKAEKCINTVLSLNNYNRFILRSAARFFMHIDNPDKSLYILNSSPSISSDPWLLSAEISIDEICSKKSRNIKKAKKLLNRNVSSPSDNSELYGTLSTLEFSSGNKRLGKKFFKKSLEKPNENTLAQALYLHDNFNVTFNPDEYNIPHKFEVNTWNKYKNSNYKEALKEAQKWLYYQPFSSRPALLYSYLSSVIFNDNEKSIKILKQALFSSPNNTMLLNNKAYSYLIMNKIKKAEKVLNLLNKLERNEENIPTLIATEGLLQIKKNNVAEGQKLYEKAYNLFLKSKSLIGQTRLLYFYSEAIKDVDPKKSKELKQRSLYLAKKHEVHEIQYLLEKEIKK